MIDEKRITEYMIAQLIHISRHGCSGIKCKRCVINRVCGKDASKSAEIASEMIFYARNKSVN